MLYLVTILTVFDVILRKTEWLNGCIEKVLGSATRSSTVF